jgi:cellulose synthase/poly-beta-1,6-N-acetylglucosamine synthase-like glycosyltransferase
VGIDIDPKDWSATTSEAVARSALKEAPNGHIMLLHDTPHTLQALPTVITELRNAGYRFVSLDEVLFPPERIALSRDLHLGDTDQATTTDVSLLQWFLYTQGYFDLYNISGTFDTDTDEALLQYKIVEHLADPTDITPLSSQLDASTRAHIALTQLPSVRSELATSTPHQGLTMTAIQKRGGVLFVDTLAFTVTALTALIMVAVGFLLFRFLFIVTLLSIAAYKKRRNRAVLVQVPKSRPPVTVLIPAWNESSNIRATIRSVHSQLRPKDQILVIDDGSTDDTGAIVLEYIKKERAYRKIKLLQKQNGGKAAALNYGIAHAKNKIIITLDADSIFGPETIDHLARHFTDPKVGAVGGKVYTTNKKTFINRMQALEYMIGQNIEKRAFTTINAVGVVPGPVGAWKKEALHEINGFSTDTLVEDQDATIAVLSKGYRIVYEPHAVAYTETPASIEQFLKQRFRWIFGTFQCFLKYKGIFIRAPFSNVSLIVLPNIVIYNVFVPLLFPIIDTILIVSIFTGLGGVVFLQVLLFTVVDVLYALVATLGEKRRFEYVPVMVVARFLYRQLIYYTVVRSLIRLLEGVHLAWNPLKRIGDAERFFLSKLAESAKPTTN